MGRGASCFLAGLLVLRWMAFLIDPSTLASAHERGREGLTCLCVWGGHRPRGWGAVGRQQDRCCAVLSLESRASGGSFFGLETFLHSDLSNILPGWNRESDSHVWERNSILTFRVFTPCLALPSSLVEFSLSGGSLGRH